MADTASVDGALPKDDSPSPCKEEVTVHEEECSQDGSPSSLNARVQMLETANGDLNQQLAAMTALRAEENANIVKRLAEVETREFEVRGNRRQQPSAAAAARAARNSCRHCVAIAKRSPATVHGTGPTNYIYLIRHLLT